MSEPLTLAALPDHAVLHRVSELLSQSRRAEADLLLLIGELDARRLYVRASCSSMFAYCTEVLHLSEAEAYLRITAARAARRHPAVLSMLADGRLHLSSIARLAPHLTEENRDRVLARAAHMSKRELLDLVAELAPRCDAPDSIRRLSCGTPAARSVPSPERHAGLVGPAACRREAAAEAAQDNCVSRALAAPDATAPPSSTAFAGAVAGSRAAVVSGAALVTGQAPGSAAHRHLAWPSADASRARIEPLSPDRYKFQFTGSARLGEKLERLQELMRVSAPDTDMAAVVEAAVTEKLDRLEARRYGATPKPRRTEQDSDTRPKTRHIPAAIRRAVWRRDGGRCRFVDDSGRRCEARRGLELHHRHPFGLGGDHAVANVCLMCRTHNRYVAEIDYGHPGLHDRRQPVPPRPPAATATLDGRPTVLAARPPGVESPASRAHARAAGTWAEAPPLAASRSQQPWHARPSPGARGR